MAQRKKKRPPVGKRKSIARRKARKPSKFARKRLAKRTLTKAIESKRPAKAKLKGGAKKARKKVSVRKPPSTPVVETVVVDVVEEPVPGVTVVTEFEATEVRDSGAGREESEESRSAPPESEEQ
jgi:hypothetical protein